MSEGKSGGSGKPKAAVVGLAVFGCLLMWVVASVFTGAPSSKGQSVTSSGVKDKGFAPGATVVSKANTLSPARSSTPSPPPADTPVPDPRATQVVISTTLGFLDQAGTPKVNIVPGVMRFAAFSSAVAREDDVLVPTFWDAGLMHLFAYVRWEALSPRPAEKPMSLSEQRVAEGLKWRFMLTMASFALTFLLAFAATLLVRTRAKFGYAGVVVISVASLVVTLTLFDFSMVAFWVIFVLSSLLWFFPFGIWRERKRKQEKLFRDQQELDRGWWQMVRRGQQMVDRMRADQVQATEREVDSRRTPIAQRTGRPKVISLKEELDKRKAMGEFR